MALRIVRRASGRDDPPAFPSHTQVNGTGTCGRSDVMRHAKHTCALQNRGIGILSRHFAATQVEAPVRFNGAGLFPGVSGASSKRYKKQYRAHCRNHPVAFMELSFGIVDVPASKRQPSRRLELY